MAMQIHPSAIHPRIIAEIARNYVISWESHKKARIAAMSQRDTETDTTDKIIWSRVYDQLLAWDAEAFRNATK